MVHRVLIPKLLKLIVLASILNLSTKMLRKCEQNRFNSCCACLGSTQRNNILQTVHTDRHIFKTTLLDSGDLSGYNRWKLYIDYFYDYYTITLYVIKLFNNLHKFTKDESNLKIFKNILNKFL